MPLKQRRSKSRVSAKRRRKSRNSTQPRRSRNRGRRTHRRRHTVSKLPKRQGSIHRKRKRRLSNKITVGVSNVPAQVADMHKLVRLLVESLLENAGHPVVFYHINNHGNHVNSWRYLPHSGTLEIWDVNGRKANTLSPTQNVIQKLSKRVGVSLQVLYPVLEDLKSSILNANYACREYNDALFRTNFGQNKKA